MSQQPRSLHVEATRAATRAFDWLQSRPCLPPREPHALALGIDWLVALWMCENAFLIADGNDSRAGAQELVEYLEQLSQSETFAALFACDAQRVVMAYGILRKHSVGCPNLDKFITALAASLDANKRADLATDVFEVRFLLSELGVVSPPLPVPLSEADLPSTVELLQADEGAVRSVEAQVAASSACGTIEAAIDPGARRTITAVIPVWLTDFARGYRIERVARLCRDLAYLDAGDDDPAIGGLRFLLGQQHPEGSFGYFGPEAARSRSESPGSDELVLYVPAAVACLWALAECGRAFRVATSI
jgi:hypothetical protein